MHANSDDQPPATNHDGKDAFRYLVDHAHSLLVSSRMRFLFVIIVAFKKETITPVSKRNMKRIVRGMETVARWMNEGPREPHQLYLYHLLLEAMNELTGRLPMGCFKGNIAGLAQRILDVIAEAPSHRTREYIAKIRHRAVKLAAKLIQWPTSDVPEETLDEALKTMDGIVNYVTVGWAPWQDPTVLKCAKILKTHVVQRQQAACTTPRDKWRMLKVKRWKLEEPLSKQE